MANIMIVHSICLLISKNFYQATKVLFSSTAFITSFLLFCLVYYFFKPGFFFSDSLEQYYQSLSMLGGTSDRPRVMPLIWKITNKFVGKPNGMFFFHQALYWTAICVFVTHIERRAVWQAILVLIIGLFPPTFQISLYISRDAGALTAFMMAIATMLLYRKSQNTLYIILALLFIAYGWSVRINSRYSAWVLTFLAAYLIGVNKKSYNNLHLRMRPYVLSFVFVVFINTLLVDAINRPVKRLWSVYLWDIAAISVIADKQLFPRDLLPEELKKASDAKILKRLQQAYTIDSNVPVMYLANDYEHKYLTYWIKLMFEYPIPYLKHRVAFMHRLLSGNLFNESSDECKLHKDLCVTPKIPESALEYIIRHSMILHNSYLYLVLGFLQLCFILKNRDDLNKVDRIIIVAIIVSGFSYVIRSFITGSSVMFRYNTWLHYSILISLILHMKYSKSSQNLLKKYWK